MRDAGYPASLTRSRDEAARAGEEFFEHLNGVEPENKELFEVYTHCLSLGFTGRYHTIRDIPKLTEIKERTLENFLGKPIPASTLEGEKLFPEAYLQKAELKKTPHLMLRSILIFALLCLGSVVLILFLRSSWDAKLNELMTIVAMGLQ